MRIAVEGCAHGCLEEIYGTIQDIEKRHGYKVDLLLCCGDFQSVRNLEDLKTMACPDKYKSAGSFYKYYSGELVAPVLTIFIGGNHEASNYLQELPYGGWVAPKIYFLGKASVVNVGGIRIGGISGIYKSYNYTSGHHEHLPYSTKTLKSVYHIRNLEVFRLKQLAKCPPDIMLSHDWPCGITDYGDVEQLLRFKPYFKDDIEKNALGSPPCMELLHILQPKYWFSGHLHAKFSALVKHKDSNKETKFLALDKCLPKRRFLQIIDFPNQFESPSISHDPEWFAILKSSNDLLSVNYCRVHMPGPGYPDRFNFCPTTEEVENIKEMFQNKFLISEDSFVKSTKNIFEKPDQAAQDLFKTPMPSTPIFNPQTNAICKKLNIFDPVHLSLKNKNEVVGLTDFKDEECNDESLNHSVQYSFNKDEIILSDEEENSSFSKDEDPFVKANHVSHNKDEIILSDEEEEEKIKDSFVKATTDDLDKTDEQSFVIDSSPSPNNYKNDEEPSSKKRFIKRRNKSIYNATDD